MAQVRLGLFEIENRKLPMLCLRCGESATDWVDRTFKWRPTELTSIGNPMRTMSVAVPLCERHRNHWAWRVWLNLALIPVAVLLVLGFLAALIVLPEMHEAKGSITGFLCAGGFLLTLVVFVVNMIFDLTLIKPREITERSILLDRVSEEFAEAVEKTRDLPGK